MGVGEKRHILIVEKSALARNVYKIIFKKTPEFVLHLVGSLEDVDNIIADASSCHAMIFNSNVCTRNTEHIQRVLAEESPYSKLPKLIICAKSSVTKWDEWCEDGLARILERPFHPDEFVREIRRVLGKG